MNESFTLVGTNMKVLQENTNTIGVEVGNVLNANEEIVGSISLLSTAADDVLDGSQTCKETIDGAVEKVREYVDKIEKTFEQLKVLVEMTQAE